MNGNREKIIERIRALRARAENEASSPEEVSAAASRAAKLISEYEIKESELVDETSAVGLASLHEGRREQHPALRAAAFGIQKLTECKVYWSGGHMLIAGLDADREFAVYLSELVLGASERGWKRARDEYGLRGAKKRRWYLHGFGESVAVNLYLMARERAETRRRKTGTDLVPVKAALIEAHMRDEFGEIKDGRSYKPRKIDPLANALGRRDGDQLNLARPLNGGERTETLEEEH